MPTKVEAQNTLAKATGTALKSFNSAHSQSWSFGDNWTNQGTEFETLINKFLFPKLDETLLINVALGNRFNWLAKETDFIGQLSEEYVILDSVPTSMNLSAEAELMLKQNYPKMATRLYGAGVLKKQKFTLNNNDVRLNFATLGDAVNYAVSVYRKKISDINVSEEREIKAMLIDYALNQASDKREVTSMDALATETFNAVLNLQNNSIKYNEAKKASGGQLGQYTTVSALDNLIIITNDKVKTFLLDTKIANTFNAQGIDLTKKIVSFDDLGGNFKVTADIEVKEQATVDALAILGDYQTKIGTIIPKDSTLTFDASAIAELAPSVVEVAPTSDIFAYILDVNKLRYKRVTNGMLKPAFYNGENDEVTYWLHYYSRKNISPFYNSVVITEKKA